MITTITNKAGATHKTIVQNQLSFKMPIIFKTMKVINHKPENPMPALLEELETYLFPIFFQF